MTPSRPRALLQPKHEYGALRNRIVHDYDELDDAVVWQAARQLVPDGRALVAALTARLAAGPPAP